MVTFSTLTPSEVVDSSLGDNITLQNLGSSYSKIIDPISYNRLMTNEHLYIALADKFIMSVINDLAQASSKPLKVVEIGCGPARITQSASKISNIDLMGLDLDENFIAYAKSILPNIPFINQSIIEFKSTDPVNIFYSQGFHHHLEKGESTNSYLCNVYNQLSDQGYYLVGDEFIPDYKDETEREIRLVIWYSHIIAHALKHKFDYLAQEEAKTLLDDINEGKVIKSTKNETKINLVLASVTDIDTEARKGDIKIAENLAKALLEKLELQQDIKKETSDAILLSRRDYKISERVFKEEVEKAGFKIIQNQAFGPIENIGAMVVFVLQKC